MRPSAEWTWLEVARVIARRGTCARRQVGCVLVNHEGKVLATGYNGPASGLPHCIQSPCAGAEAKSGEGLDKCEAIHAEQNALMQCADITDIAVCYVTTSPCIHCVKMLMNTSCYRIVFLEEYAHATAAKSLWLTSQGRQWEHFVSF